MFDELLITAIIAPLLGFFVWLMKKVANKGLKALETIVDTNGKFADIIQNELRELKEEVRKGRK